MKHRLLTHNKVVLTILGLIFLLLFFGFTLWVRADHLRSFDFDSTVRLQQNTPISFDPFFSFLSVAGRFEFTIVILISILLIWTRLKISKFLRVIIIIGIFGVAHVVELIGKTILEQPGPPRMFLRSEFSDFPGLHVFTDASYPSGHSLRIVFLGVIIAFLLFKSKLPRNIKLFSYATISTIVALMLYSRVSLGEHWTTDVMGGVLLGISGALLSLVLLM